MGFSLDYIRADIASYPPGSRLKHRKMADFELVWIQRGNAVYHINKQDLPAPPGTMILSRPGFEEGYTWDPAEPTRHAYFHFLFKHPPADWPALANWPIVQTMPANDIVRPLFAYLVACARKQQSDAVTPMLQRAVEMILSALLVGPLTGPAEPPRPYPEPINRALAYIGQRLSNDAATPVFLADLAEAALVSEKHLCRIFAAELQTSPMEVVTGYRLHHGAELLARTDLKLAVVARQCGFASVFHFSRRFKEFYGKPPRKFRADALAGEAIVPQLRLGKMLLVEY